VTDSLTFSAGNLPEKTCEIALNAKKKGWNKLFEEHSVAMQERWSRSEVIIDGNIEDQQNQRRRIFLDTLNLDED
jgi:trehalose/maltose hydrolase-like predicted phosphorylase